MASQIHLYPSDLTPPPGVFQTLVVEVLTARGAIWESQEHGELRLSDGTEIGLFTDEEENVAVFVLEAESEAAFDLIHDVADRTASFVTVGDRACATPSAGDILPDREALHGDPTDVRDRRDFDDWLRVALCVAATPRATTAAAPAAPPAKSLIQRLSDALFGKSI